MEVSNEEALNYNAHRSEFKSLESICEVYFVDDPQKAEQRRGFEKGLFFEEAAKKYFCPSHPLAVPGIFLPGSNGA